MFLDLQKAMSTSVSYDFTYWEKIHLRKVLGAP